MENFNNWNPYTEFNNVFSPGLGTYRGDPARFSVDQSIAPRFFKARPVPWAYRSRVDEEIDCLGKAGIIRPIDSSDWAAPVVPVLKGDGSIRLCGDYKVTINQCSPLNRYPLPHVKDLFIKLAGARYFSKIDLSQAYLQLPVHKDDQLLLAINTSKGLYAPTRLPFGVASAPSIFQREMDSLLKVVEREEGRAMKVACFQDDIVIASSTRDQHVQDVNAVLRKISDKGLKLQKSKCVFAAEEILYLGHRLSFQGIQPCADKVAAIKDAPAPQDVSQLRSFLGALEYYSDFMPSKSSILHPLHALLRKGVHWKWHKHHQHAFQVAKKRLMLGQSAHSLRRIEAFNFVA